MVWVAKADIGNYLLTVLITAVTGGPTSAVNPVRVVALDLARLVDKPVGTEEVGPPLCVAVPVLGAVEHVRVPVVLPPHADVSGVVVGRTTVGITAATIGAIVLFAVAVAVVANLAIPTANAVGPVALNVVRVVLEVLSLLGLAHEVGPVAIRAVPVLPAVVRIWIPPVLQVCAVHHVSTVRCCCDSRSTVVVALVTNRPAPALSVGLVIAAHVDKVKHLWDSMFIIWTEKVLFSSTPTS